MLKIAYHPIYKHSLPEGQRFPMEKYELLSKRLLHEGTSTAEIFFEPEPAVTEHIFLNPDTDGVEDRTVILCLIAENSTF